MLSITSSTEYITTTTPNVTITAPELQIINIPHIAIIKAITKLYIQTFDSIAFNFIDKLIRRIAL